MDHVAEMTAIASHARPDYRSDRANRRCCVRSRVTLSVYAQVIRRPDRDRLRPEMHDLLDRVNVPYALPVGA
jgi:hypothetical protein